MSKSLTKRLNRMERGQPQGLTSLILTGNVNITRLAVGQQATDALRWECEPDPRTFVREPVEPVFPPNKKGTTFGVPSQLDFAIRRAETTNDAIYRLWRYANQIHAPLCVSWSSRSFIKRQKRTPVMVSSSVFWWKQLDSNQ